MTERLWIFSLSFFHRRLESTGDRVALGTVLAIYEDKRKMVCFSEVDDLLLGGVFGGLVEDAIHQKESLDFPSVLLFATEGVAFGSKWRTRISGKDRFFGESFELLSRQVGSVWS